MEKTKQSSGLEIHSLYNTIFECRFDKTSEDRVFITQVMRDSRKVIWQGIKPIEKAREDYRRLRKSGWSPDRSANRVDITSNPAQL